LTLASCCGNPIKRNSVLDELRLRKLEVIQDEMEAIFLSIYKIVHYKAECHLHVSDVLEASLVAVDDDCGSQVG